MYHCRLSVKDIHDEADIDDFQSYRTECGSIYAEMNRYKNNKRKCILTILAVFLFAALFGSVYLAGM